MIIQSKYFHDSQNIVVTLVHVREVVYVKCAKFPLFFME